MEAIADVQIMLTLRSGIQRFFTLQAPNGDEAFSFGFRKIPLLGEYEDGDMTIQHGATRYQFFATYTYVWHEMDLRNLLRAASIQLRFPPRFGSVNLYQSVDVILENEDVVRNWLAGIVAGSASADAVPAGEGVLEFVGSRALTESEVMAFDWGSVTDGSDDGFPDGLIQVPEEVEIDLMLIGGGGNGGPTFFPPPGTPIATGGGGGAGGRLYEQGITLSAGFHTYQIGHGGRATMVGQVSDPTNSVFFGRTAVRGGRGGWLRLAGGSGGGGASISGSSSPESGGSGTVDQGNAGGAGAGTPSTRFAGSGGGSGAEATSDGGAGSDLSLIYGDFIKQYGESGYFCGGGGGFASLAHGIQRRGGGVGGGGQGAHMLEWNVSILPPDSAVPNSGGGGGGGFFTANSNSIGGGVPGGDGADGVMIISHAASLGQFLTVPSSVVQWVHDEKRHYLFFSYDQEPPPPPGTRSIVFEKVIPFASDYDRDSVFAVDVTSGLIPTTRVHFSMNSPGFLGQLEDGDYSVQEVPSPYYNTVSITPQMFTLSEGNPDQVVQVTNEALFEDPPLDPPPGTPASITITFESIDTDSDLYQWGGALELMYPFVPLFESVVLYVPWVNGDTIQDLAAKLNAAVNANSSLMVRSEIIDPVGEAKAVRLTEKRPGALYNSYVMRFTASPIIHVPEFENSIIQKMSGGSDG